MCSEFNDWRFVRVGTVQIQGFNPIARDLVLGGHTG